MTVVVRGVGEGPFTTEVDVNGYRVVADEPIAAGGTDLGPSPYDLLLAALGSCTAMTVRLHAGRRGYPLDDVAVTLTHERAYAVDCADCDTRESRLERIVREIRLTGDLTPNQRTDLIRIADRCPVHRTLTEHVEIETRSVG